LFYSPRRPPHSTPVPSTPLFRSDLADIEGDRSRNETAEGPAEHGVQTEPADETGRGLDIGRGRIDLRAVDDVADEPGQRDDRRPDRKSTRLNSSHVKISYAVFCL